MANGKRKVLTTVAASSLIVFTMLSVISATIAWFTLNNKIGNSGNNTRVEQKERFSKISYYNYKTATTPTEDACDFELTPYATISYNSDTKTFDKPVNGSGQTINSFDLVMSQYDPMNKHKPVLVIAELSGNTNTSISPAVKVLAKTNTIDFLGQKNENHTAKYTLGNDSALKIDTINDVDYYPLSSVVCFKSKAFSESEYNDWIRNKSAHEVRGLTATGQNAEWLSPDDHNFSEASIDADTSSFFQESNIYNSDTRGDVTIKYIAVVVDYYDLAIEYIYSTFLGNEVLELTYHYVLNFTCDWKWEIG